MSLYHDEASVVRASSVNFSQKNPLVMNGLMDFDQIWSETSLGEGKTILYNQWIWSPGAEGLDPIKEMKRFDSDLV